jgi:hypothetical protein
MVVFDSDSIIDLAAQIFCLASLYSKVLHKFWHSNFVAEFGLVERLTSKY